MDKTVTLLFAHGGGFCKEIWEPIMRRLRESPLLQSAPVNIEFESFDFTYHGTNRDEYEEPQLDQSNPNSPRVYHSSGDLNTWITAEMFARVRELQRKNPDRPVIGIGHSMGACALWNTEVNHPGTFSGLILFEPVYGDMNVDHISDFLVLTTLQRESSWPSREAAEEHLRNYNNFSAWDSESLEAYMKGGLVEDKSSGLTKLACSPLMEASLYSGHKLMFCSDEQLARVKCRVFFHSGGRTKMFEPSIFQAMHEKWPLIYSVAEPIPRCSHALVMEKPAAVAQNILSNLAELEPFHGASRVSRL